MYTIKSCEATDILRIRDFLKETYTHHKKKINWLIDRLNFTYSLSRVMNGVSEVLYRDKIIIIEKNHTIEAIVMTEGEDQGEAFFQLRQLACDETLIALMFDFVETHLMKEEDGGQYVNLRIQRGASGCIDEAIKRGFIKDWTEVTSRKKVKNDLSTELHDDYHIASVNGVTAEDKAVAHAKAFGYHDDVVYVNRSIEGMTILKTMPDFQPELDIQIMSKDNEIAAFCTMWYDNQNNIGVLEPVGTLPDHRRKGLAKSAIFEACNRVMDLGAEAVYVGSDQKFYKAIGFEEVSYDDVYKKSIKRC